MDLPVLALNVGSSSLKFGLYLVGSQGSRVLLTAADDTQGAPQQAIERISHSEFRWVLELSTPTLPGYGIDLHWNDDFHHATHVCLTGETNGILDARRLALLRDGALFVNAGRGRTVDTAALARELASGRLRAALDVVDPEPLPPDHPLWALPNVLITPHMAGDSPSTTIRCIQLAGAQIRRFAAGQPLVNEVPRYLLE